MPDSATTDAPADNPTSEAPASTGEQSTTDITTPPEGAAPSAPDNKTVFDLDYVKGLRTESAGYRTKLRDAETARDTASTRVSELEASVPALEQRATAAEALAARYEVALEKGLPLTLAKRLVGATREELLADAEALASDVGPSRLALDLGQGARTPAPAPKDVNAGLRALINGTRK